MIPEREARLVPSTQAEQGEDDSIRFARGVDPAEVGTQVFLARATCAAGTRIRAHWHSHDTVAYLTAGRARFLSGPELGEVHELSTGDWLFVPAGMLHAEETPDDEGGEFLYARDGAGGTTTYAGEA